jgi:hypothetical protein
VANDVIFRRINGRIVAIKPPKTKQGAAAYVGAGVGVGATAGLVSAHLARASAKNENESRTIYEKAVEKGLAKDKTAVREFRVASKFRMESHRQWKASVKFKKGGADLGAGLIAAGTYRALKSSDLTTTEKTAVAATAGIGAHFAIRSAYTYSMHPTKNIFNAFKHAAERIAVRGFKL